MKRELQFIRVVMLESFRRNGKIDRPRRSHHDLRRDRGGLVVTPIENDRRAEALRKMVATMPRPGKSTLIVTHKPNILDANGKEWFEVKEGEASIFHVDASAKPELFPAFRPSTGYGQRATDSAPS